jgi:hypothetical protein
MLNEVIGMGNFRRFTGVTAPAGPQHVVAEGFADEEVALGVVVPVEARIRWNVSVV